MSQSSPCVRRLAAILNFIADHPGQAFGMTDLVRALKLSRSTCHALLTGLVDVGYLYRTGDKTYVLGPALAAVGRTAADHFSLLQVAEPEMRSIADDFDVVCGAYFLEGDIMHLRARTTSASHVGYPVPLGTRMPLTTVQATSPWQCERHPLSPRHSEGLTAISPAAAAAACGPWRFPLRPGRVSAASGRRERRRQVEPASPHRGPRAPVRRQDQAGRSVRLLEERTALHREVPLSPRPCVTSPPARPGRLARRAGRLPLCRPAQAPEHDAPHRTAPWSGCPMSHKTVDRRSVGLGAGIVPPQIALAS